ncbi:hypothetical protein V8F33_002073 [Rhypophila sp. PSN 637]
MSTMSSAPSSSVTVSLSSLLLFSQAGAIRLSRPQRRPVKWILRGQADSQGKSERLGDRRWQVGKMPPDTDGDSTKCKCSAALATDIA